MFAVRKGYSFIRSREATEAFGMDVFLHSSQKGDFNLNDQVCFAVLLNKDGKPQAFDLTKPTETDIARWGHVTSVTPVTQPAKTVEAWVPASDTWEEPQKGLNEGKIQTGAGDGRYTGTISAFKPSLYGFIKCPELFAQTQHDVWVHHKQIQDFKVGDMVTFTAITNKNGQPQAIDLQAAVAAAATVQGQVVPARAPAPRAAQTVPPREPPKQVPPRHGYAATAKPAGAPQATPIGARKRPAQDYSPPEADPTTLVGTRQWGTITAWRPGGKYGFLKCEETFAVFHKDCWVHHQQMGGFNEGDTVSFTVVMNKEGNPQAVDLQAEDNKRFRKLHLARKKLIRFVSVGLLPGMASLGRLGRSALGRARRGYATLLLAEHNNKSLNKATLHAVTAASKLPGCTSVDLLVAGKGCGEVAKAGASAEGVSKVLVAESDQLEHPVADVMAELTLDSIF
eukprot:s1410_g12.t1